MFRVQNRADCHYEATAPGVDGGAVAQPEGGAPASAMGTGSGPEGSSLTVDIQRSRDTGAEEA